MLYQLHWQHRTDRSLPTIFVAQDEWIQGQDPADILKRFTAIIERRKDDIPLGYCPMICDEKAPEFAVAVPIIKEGAD